MRRLAKLSPILLLLWLSASSAALAMPALHDDDTEISWFGNGEPCDGESEKETTEKDSKADDIKICPLDVSHKAPAMNAWLPGCTTADLYTSFHEVRVPPPEFM